jgi:hypothetical protein
MLEGGAASDGRGVDVTANSSTGALRAGAGGGSGTTSASASAPLVRERVSDDALAVEDACDACASDVGPAKESDGLVEAAEDDDVARALGGEGEGASNAGIAEVADAWDSVRRPPPPPPGPPPPRAGGGGAPVARRFSSSPRRLSS